MNNQEYYSKARKLIPGGTQLLSKRPEMFLPNLWPSYYQKAKGAFITDLEGNEYTDMSIMGIGACILGYADEHVDSAVKNAIENGVSSTLNCYEEVDLAEKLCKLHPWANMVRYCRSGGEAAAMAVRIARAKTGNDVVAFSGYHGWCDWYLAANLGDNSALDGHLMPGLDPAGVPRNLKGTAFPFHYGDIENLQGIVDQHGENLAAIVMEPARASEPDISYLKKVREIADSVGAVLIFDEITSGFRLYCGGIHMNYGVYPDIAIFAKAMSNGYAMAAVIGRDWVMDAAQSTFMSSTNWTERIGPVAALATIEKFEQVNLSEHLASTGKMVQNGWIKAAKETGLSIEVDGLLSINHFMFSSENSLALNTLYTQMMLEKGYLAWIQNKNSLVHTKELVDRYLTDTTEVFYEIQKAIENDLVNNLLKGPVSRQGFYRLTK